MTNIENDQTLGMNSPLRCKEFVPAGVSLVLPFMRNASHTSAHTEDTTELGLLIPFIIEKPITTIVILPYAYVFLFSTNAHNCNIMDVFYLSIFRKVNLKPVALVRVIPSALLLQAKHLV